MLGKLIKYEFKAMGRVMLPLYAVMIFLAGLLSFNLKTGMNDSAQSLLQKFAIILTFLFFAAVMAVFVVMVIMVIQRFYKNLLGTEGYLMFTLPVSTWQHILSKAITAMIWIVLGIAAGTAAGFLMVGILSSVPEFVKQVQDAWRMIVGNKDIGARIAVVVIVLILGVIASLCKVYASIAIGHQFNSHRLLMSVLAYIAIGVVEVLITSIPFVNRFIDNSRAFFDTQPAGAYAFTIGSFTPFMVISLLQICVYGFVTWYLLDRRLNLE